jgi:hypothetical protein
MRYIRKIDELTKVLSWGYVDNPGDLGVAPPGFEDVADTEGLFVDGKLPDGFECITLLTKREQIRAIYQAQPLQLRLAFGELFARANAFWDNGDEEAVQAIIQAADVPAELEPLKQQMLAVLNG